MAASKKRSPKGRVAAAPPSAPAVRTGTPVAVALFVVAIVALLIPPIPQQQLGMDFVAAWAGVAGLVAAVGLLLVKADVSPRGLLGVAWAAFLGWALVSALASGRLWGALVGEPTNRLGWMTLVALTAVALATSAVAPAVRRLLRENAWWIVLAEVSFTLYRLTVVRSATIGGTLPNSTYLGEALVLLLPWVLPDERVTRASERRMRYLAAALTVFTMAATQSRAALLVTGLWLLWVIARRWRTRAFYKVGAVVALLSAVAVAAFGFLPTSVIDPDGPLPLGGRLAMWELAGRAVLARPLTGWGPDGFWPGAAHVRTPEIAARGHSLLLGPGASDPHNAIAWIAASTGIVGLALAVWFAARVAIAWRRRLADDPDTVAAIWGVCGCLAIGLLSPLSLNVLVLFALVAGTSLGALPVRGSTPWRELRVPVTAVAVAVALVSAVFSLNAFTRAQYEVASGERSPRLAPGAVSARSLWPLDAHLAYLSSLHAGWAAQSDPAGGWSQVDLAALDRAVELDRANPFYALERARAVKHYRLPAATVDDAFGTVFERYPAYPLARAEYALYLAETGRTEEARAELEAIAAIDDVDPARVAAVEAATAAIAAGAP